MTVIGGTFKTDLFTHEVRSSCEQLQFGADEWAEMAPLPMAGQHSWLQLADLARGCICVLQEQPSPEAAEAAAAGVLDPNIRSRRELVCHCWDLDEAAGAPQEATWRTKTIIGRANATPVYYWQRENRRNPDENARWLSEHGSSQKAS